MLYIVTPPYIFEKTDQGVVYDDSVVLDESWDELELAAWHIYQKESHPRTNDERRKIAYEKAPHDKGICWVSDVRYRVTEKWLARKQKR